MKSSLEGEKEVARTDALTGVGNRRSFVESAGIGDWRAQKVWEPVYGHLHRR